MAAERCPLALGARSELPSGLDGAPVLEELDEPTIFAPSEGLDSSVLKTSVAIGGNSCGLIVQYLAAGNAHSRHAWPQYVVVGRGSREKPRSRPIVSGLRTNEMTWPQFSLDSHKGKKEGSRHGGCHDRWTWRRRGGLHARSRSRSCREEEVLYISPRVRLLRISYSTL